MKAPVAAASSAVATSGGRNEAVTASARMPPTRDNDRWGIEAFSSKAKRRSPVRAGSALAQEGVRRRACLLALR